MRCPVVMSVDGTIACDGTGGPVTDARLPLTTRILLRGPLVGLEDCCGPFYEPERARPMVSLEEYWARVASLEAVPSQLLSALQRTLAVSTLFGAALGIVAGILAGAALAPGAAFDALAVRSSAPL